MPFALCYMIRLRTIEHEHEPGEVQEETTKLAAEACAAGTPPEVRECCEGSSSDLGRPKHTDCCMAAGYCTRQDRR